MLVRRPASQTADVTIADLKWVGLRCRLEVVGATSTMRVDLRTKPAQADSSVAGGGKPLGADGRASLVVENDSAHGMVAVVVVTDANGAVVCKATTTVGGES